MKTKPKTEFERDYEMVFSLKRVGHRFVSQRARPELAAVCFREALGIVRGTPEHTWEKGLKANLTRLSEKHFQKYLDDKEAYYANQAKTKTEGQRFDEWANSPAQALLRKLDEISPTNKTGNPKRQAIL